MGMDFKEYLLKGAAYGIGAGTLVGATDDDLGPVGGGLIGGLFGMKAATGMPIVRKLTAENVNNILKADSPTPSLIKKWVENSNVKHSMTSAINRGVFVGSAAGGGIGAFSDDTGVFTGTIEGAVAGAALGFGRNKNWLSLTAAGFTKNSKKTGSSNAAINAVT